MIPETIIIEPSRDDLYFSDSPFEKKNDDVRLYTEEGVPVRVICLDNNDARKPPVIALKQAEENEILFCDAEGKCPSNPKNNIVKRVKLCHMIQTLRQVFIKLDWDVSAAVDEVESEYDYSIALENTLSINNRDKAYARGTSYSSVSVDTDKYIDEVSSETLALVNLLKNHGFEIDEDALYFCSENFDGKESKKDVIKNHVCALFIGIHLAKSLGISIPLKWDHQQNTTDFDSLYKHLQVTLDSIITTSGKVK